MSKSSAPAQIKGGLPWWLWGLLSFATIAIVAGIAISSTPDDPQVLFDEALLTIPRDVKAGKACLEKLRPFEDYKWEVKYLEGMVAFREQRDPRALKLLAEIPEDHKLKPDAMRQMGDSYRRTRQYKESMEAYQKAVALSPDTNVDASVSLASMYIGIGAHQLAEQVLNDAIAKDPTHTRALESRALSRATEQRYPEAIEDFRVILSTPGEFSAATPSLLGAYGNAILKAQDKELIQMAVDDHLSLFEENSQKMAMLIALGKLDEAEAVVRPDATQSANQLPQPERKKLALIEIERGEWKKAEKLIRPILMTMPRDVEVFDMAARVYKETDNAARQAVAEENVTLLKELDAKLIASIRSVGDNIDDGAGRADVARTYMELADFPSAIRWFAVAVTLDEKYGKELNEASTGVTFPRTPLVEFPATPEDEVKPAAADGSDESEETPKTTESEEESPAKNETEEAATPVKSDKNSTKEESADDAAESPDDSAPTP